MLLLLTILCVTSFLVLSALLWLKQWEVSTGCTVDTEDSSRMRLHDWGQWVILNVVRLVPSVIVRFKSCAIELMDISTHWFKASFLYASSFVHEARHKLQQKQRAQSHRVTDRRASSFLLEVSEYKQSLLHHVSRPKRLSHDSEAVKE